MLTNGTAPAENYYLVKFASMPYEVFAYGDSPLSAIREARAELYETGADTETDLPSLGGALVRRAVYKEWNNSTWRYRNDGGFIKGENWASEAIDYGMEK